MQSWLLFVSDTVVGHLVILLNFMDKIIDPWKLELTYFGGIQDAATPRDTFTVRFQSFSTKEIP